MNATSLAGLEILVAEDSPDIQVLMGHYLKAAGARSDIVQNGAEAVAKATTKVYDLILMDIEMPICSGSEAVQGLRAQGYRGLIFALTAHRMNGDLALLLGNGFDDCLQKPLNRQALFAKVHSYGALSAKVAAAIELKGPC